MNMLPFWLQVTGLILSLLWPIYQLFRIIAGATLKAKLTKDLFFRFIDQGECIFLRPALISEHGNILINNVTAILSRTGPGASKSWELEFLKFGEVLASEKQVESSFCFHSSSPARFLSKGVPVQAVYLARPRQYGIEYAKLVKEFNSRLLPFKIDASRLKTNRDDAEESKFQQSFERLCDEYSKKLLDKIQLEAGSYEISMTVSYSGIGGIASYFGFKTRASKLNFDIEDTARDNIKAALPAAIQNAALNYIFNSERLIAYPEYVPTNVVEDSKL